MPDVTGGPHTFLDHPTSDAPSELTLDRYVAGELDANAKDLVDRWRAAAPENQARLDARRRFPNEGDAERLFARIESRLPATSPTSRPPERGPAAWLRRLLGPGLVMAATVALVLVVVRPWQADPDTIRVKGGFGYLVHKKTPTGSEVVVSGAEARAGDVLRFELDLPEPGWVMVLDQDPGGALSTAWPLGAAVPERAQRLEPGARALDGAVELDGAVGDEWLHAVVCEREFARDAITIAGPGALTLPAGCRTQALHLKKVR